MGKDRKQTQRGAKAATLPLNARSLAVRTLLRVEAGMAVQQALDFVLQEVAQKDGHALDTRDKGLCTELVYGCLRTQIRVNAVLHKVLSAPEKLPKELHTVLALGVYSLLFLHKVPQHASVHWAVEHVRARFGARMSGLANGVLRSVQRLGDAPQHKAFYTAEGCSALEQSALFYATPLWLAQMWNKSYGLDAALALMHRAMSPPRPCVRINARHAQGNEVRAALLQQGGDAVGDHGVVFGVGEVPLTVLDHSLSHWHDAGVLSWQAAGSLAVLDAVSGFVQGSAVWDACTGQGGKALALLERGVDVPLCSDISVPRLRQLRRTAQRLELRCPQLVRMSAVQPALSQWNGALLLDVPCSGFGTLARRPEIRVRRSQEDVTGLVHVQRKMLEQGWSVLEAGGVLIYMTCTLNPAENDEQVRSFVQERSHAQLVLEWQTPHDHEWLEGMYVAVLQKSGA